MVAGMNKQKFIQMIERGIAHWKADVENATTEDFFERAGDRHNLYQLLTMSLQTESTREDGIALIIECFTFIQSIGACLLYTSDAADD